LPLDVNSTISRKYVLFAKNAKDNIIKMKTFPAGNIAMDICGFYPESIRGAVWHENRIIV
jgi:hypothetical protein